ncbi:hypothetical protein [Bacillus alkalicellulosilyticus]|uniref:hypothetical protein n=1 Tax=Alkalihalobacterium alkalicellulosilyticum TaxID=1912214 RepID=UPI000996A0CB|nr:hypothetical protein [Bacillus alkalicellulosilyticus]
MQKNKSLLKVILIVSVLVMSFAFVTTGTLANSGAWTHANITPDGNINNSGVYDDLNNIVYFIMALGGFFVVVMLIIGGMLLAGSNGNPQRRTAGLVSLACCFGGGWVIMKAHTIAGWIAGFGA